MRSRRQRLHNMLGTGMHGEDEHPHPGRLLREFARGIDAVEFRHRDIENGDLRAVLARQLHRLASVRRGGDNRDIGIFFQQFDQPLAHQGVIISHQHTNRFAHAYLLGCAGRPAFQRCRDFNRHRGAAA